MCRTADSIRRSSTQPKAAFTWWQPVNPLLPHVQAGKIKLLAFINRGRAPFAPDVPTVAEAGYADLTFRAVTGFFGWRDMPADLRERIATDVREIAADSAIGDRLAKMGATVQGSTPAEFATMIEEQRVQVAAIAAATGPVPAQ